MKERQGAGKPVFSQPEDRSNASTSGLRARYTYEEIAEALPIREEEKDVVGKGKGKGKQVVTIYQEAAKRRTGEESEEEVRVDRRTGEVGKQRATQATAPAESSKAGASRQLIVEKEERREKAAKRQRGVARRARAERRAAAVKQREEGKLREEAAGPAGRWAARARAAEASEKITQSWAEAARLKRVAERARENETKTKLAAARAERAREKNEAEGAERVGRWAALIAAAASAGRGRLPTDIFKNPS